MRRLENCDRCCFGLKAASGKSILGLGVLAFLANTKNKPGYTCIIKLARSLTLRKHIVAIEGLFIVCSKLVTAVLIS